MILLVGSLWYKNTFESSIPLGSKEIELGKSSYLGRHLMDLISVCVVTSGGQMVFSGVRVKSWLGSPEVAIVGSMVTYDMALSRFPSGHSAPHKCLFMSTRLWASLNCFVFSALWFVLAALRFSLTQLPFCTFAFLWISFRFHTYTCVYRRQLNALCHNCSPGCPIFLPPHVAFFSGAKLSFFHRSFWLSAFLAFCLAFWP